MLRLLLLLYLAEHLLMPRRSVVLALLKVLDLGVDHSHDLVVLNQTAALDNWFFGDLQKVLIVSHIDVKVFLLLVLLLLLSLALLLGLLWLLLACIFILIFMIILIAF